MKHQAVRQPKGSASPCLFCGANFSFLFSVDEIVCTLGEGAFGKVVECIDHSKYENIPYTSEEEAEGPGDRVLHSSRIGPSYTTSTLPPSSARTVRPCLYLASYESESPENQVEKDRWKALRSNVLAKT
ncbi:hypothetical protein NQZ68_009095 [Dissostichus eleginoides]|nr:hypothetical protein NQZ68_009095 [Dissostichus eleginoides]